MAKLILFDIDGTLIRALHTSRFGRAIENVHGIEIKSDRQFNGYTDQLILAGLLEDEGWSDQQIKDAMPQLLVELDYVHKNSFKPEDLKLLPGVGELLEAIKSSGHKLGLITGNMESIAERKLEAVGIWNYFTAGGFGSDPHFTRGDLVTTAIKKFNYQANIKDVYVIGDTPLDILAATQAGVSNSIGVASGVSSTEELRSSDAKIVLKDLKDTKLVLKSLDITST